jgi:hypothetical protein
VKALALRERALRLRGLDASAREDPFAAIIRCTADPAKADKRTRSKWSRATRYAAMSKSVSEPLDQFIKRKGGINRCAARFSGSLGGRDGEWSDDFSLERGPLTLSGTRWHLLMGL